MQQSIHTHIYSTTRTLNSDFKSADKLCDEHANEEKKTHMFSVEKKYNEQGN